MNNVNIIWEPQIGPQAYASVCPLDIIFFGGTRGGGKSDAAIGRQINGALKYGSQWNGLILRKKYKDLGELYKRVREIISLGLPAKLVGGPQQSNYLRFDNGALVTFSAVVRKEQLDSFQGGAYTEISIDEAPTFSFIGDMIEMLKGALRSAHGVPCHMFLTGNPGGPGSNFIKYMFRMSGENALPPGTIITDEESGETLVFIKSTLDDNPKLCNNDPKYVNRIKSIKNEALRRAWLLGDWDVYIGQAFNLNEKHIIKPIWPIPEYSPIYFTYDWGYSAPFSALWWWVDADGRIYCFAEWYGSTGVPNKGLQMTDQEVAKGILEREKTLGINDRDIIRLCGPDCFNMRPNVDGRGTGPSTAEIFHNMGITMRPGDPSRTLKIRQFYERLSIPEDESLPMLVVYDICKNFIRTIPSLCFDDYNPEDIDSGGEDHCVDDQTEILTDEGWKLFSELNRTEEVATLNKNGNIEYQKPYDYVDREYDGKLYCHDGKINLAVTDGHRFPVINSNKNIRPRTIKDIKDNLNYHAVIPKIGKWIPTKEFNPIIDLRSLKCDNNNANNVDEIKLIDFMKYYGLWLAEGCLASYKTKDYKAKKGTRRYNVHIDGKEDLVSFINPLGYKYHITTTKSNIKRYSICSKQFYTFIYKLAGKSYCYNKFIPRWMLELPKEYLKALYEGMMFGDGTADIKYDTTSEQLADDFQELLFKLGKAGHKHAYKQNHTHILGRKIKNKLPIYRINIFTKIKTCSIVTDNIIQKPYKGRVYCVRVPNETIYLRRKGTVYWSMNCYDSAGHICMARPIGPNNVVIREDVEQKKRDKALEKLDNTSYAAAMEFRATMEAAAEAEEGYINFWCDY